MSVLGSHNNETRGGLGRVCATGMYRSIEQVKFPKFQTGMFVEWKVPLFCRSDRSEFWLNGSRPSIAQTWRMILLDDEQVEKSGRFQS